MLIFLFCLFRYPMFSNDTFSIIFVYYASEQKWAKAIAKLSPTFTLVGLFLLRQRTALTIVFGVSFDISIFRMSERRTLSNAFVKSMRQTYAGVLNSLDFSFSFLIMNMAWVMDLFHLKH